jgi:hypothetical protein
MSLYVRGIGWASPTIRGAKELVAALREPETTPSNGTLGKSTAAISDPKQRFRRAGRIAHLALAAVSDALADASKQATDQTALIFLSTHGGICHTIRFYESVAADGTHAGNPIFFPETVYNAPPSHIAAHLGINGPVVSLIGDSAAVGGAFCTAEEWIHAGLCDQCIIVAAEEMHPLLQDAYHSLKLGPGRPEIPSFLDAASAVIVDTVPKGGKIQAHPGMGLKKDREFPLRQVLQETVCDGNPNMILTSALGRTLQIMEKTIITSLWPHATILSPKSRLGESFAASSLGLVVIGEAFLRLGEARSALISLPGVNSQISAVFLTVPTR